MINQDTIIGKTLSVTKENGGLKWVYKLNKQGMKLERAHVKNCNICKFGNIGIKI